MNSYSTGTKEWLLTPSFDLGTGTSYQAEFDFGIYTWNGTYSPATCGSDDSFDFLITTDGGATWTSLFSADGNYATSIGGDRQISDLSAYSGLFNSPSSLRMELLMILKMWISPSITLRLISLLLVMLYRV